MKKETGYITNTAKLLAAGAVLAYCTGCSTTGSSSRVSYSSRDRGSSTKVSLSDRGGRIHTKRNGKRVNISWNNGSGRHGRSAWSRNDY